MNQTPQPSLAAFTDDQLLRRRFIGPRGRQVWTCHCDSRYMGSDRLVTITADNEHV